MTNEQKMRFFRHLVQIGFKEIEVAYPAASEPDFNFVRELIDGKEVPDDVWIQVGTFSCRFMPINAAIGPHTSESGSDQEDVRGGCWSQTCHHPHVQRHFLPIQGGRLQRQQRRNDQVSSLLG